MSDEQDASLQSPLVGALNRLAAAVERLATVEETRWIGPAVPVTPQPAGSPHVSVAPTRCVECGAIATALHSPNCPNGMIHARVARG